MKAKLNIFEKEHCNFFYNIVAFVRALKIQKNKNLHYIIFDKKYNAKNKKSQK